MDCPLAWPLIWSHKQQSLGITVPAALLYWHYWLFVMISKAAGTFMVRVPRDCWQESNIIPFLVCAWRVTTPPKKTKKKTKQNKGIHTELIIISCFSGVSFTGRGPPASRSRSTRWSFYCWSIMLIFYSWLWNRFHSAQITLLLCYHSPPLSHTHTHICTHAHTCTHTCTHAHMHTQTLLKRFKSARDSNIYTHKRWFPMGSERMFFSDQKWHFCLICRLKQIS